MVPQSAWPNLLAAYNSGSTSRMRAQGSTPHGTLYFPMVNGLATVVRSTTAPSTSGLAAVGPAPGPDILMARQNLPLLVMPGGDGGGGGADTNRMGSPYGGACAVWRQRVWASTPNGNSCFTWPLRPDRGRAWLRSDRRRRRPGMQLDIQARVAHLARGGRGPLPTLSSPTPTRYRTGSSTELSTDFFASSRPARASRPAVVGIVGR